MAQGTREVEGTVHSFVEDGMLAVEELRDEIQEWLDNLPENLQGGQKADELNACLGALSNADYPPDLDGVPDLPCKASQLLAKKSWGKIYMSRADRLSNAISRLDGAATVLEGVEDHAEAARCAEELREYISEFEGAEFPRAF